jgi:hypothetical protein
MVRPRLVWRRRTGFTARRFVDLGRTKSMMCRAGAL